MTDAARILGSGAVFAPLSAADVESIASMGRSIPVPPGVPIFEVGQVGEVMYAVLEGEVELRFGSGVPTKRLGPGDIFGELALVNPGQGRTATAVPLVAGRLLRFDRAAFDRMTDERPDLLLRLLQIVSTYLLDSERRLVGVLGRRNDELSKTLEYLQRTRAELTFQELLARTDDLTGLYNRRCLDEQLPALLARPGDPVALLLLDLDALKVVNDEHGHPAGDAVLRRVSDAIRDAVRRTDLPCRLGGDEFAVLVPDVDVASATERGHDLLEAIRRIDFRPPPGSVPVALTVSIGGDLARPDDDAARFIDRVDRILYRAKTAGGDRLEWGEDDGPG